MPVLEQFRNFIRHGKAAKDGYAGPDGTSARYDQQMADGYTGQTAPSGSSGYDGANHAGSSSSSSRSTAAAGGNNTSAISAGSGGFLPTAASGPTMGSSLSPAAAQTFNGGGTSVQHGNQTGAAVGATRQAAANAGLSASDRTSDGQQRRSGAAAAGESLSSPGLHADVAAQIVQEEREAAEKMPVYEGLEERFVLLSKMGDGAFSNVYKARDKKTGQKVAIKVVRKYELNSNQNDRLDPNFRKKNRVTERANILKEVQIMRGLKHDGIVTLLDFSESRDHYYLVLELLEGGELFHQIVKLTYFSEPLARHVILQVARGIRYLHEERGVVHRDIKPENLLFESIKIVPSKFNKARPYDEEKEDEGEYMPGIGGGGIGKVKIADFGLSKVVWEESTMTPCGTVGYTAPEIVKDERYSKSVDMWALGCVLYTLLCGFPPFYDESISVLTEKVAKGYYTFLSPWWDDISKSAKDLITHLLCVDPRKRYTIDEFLAHPWCNVKDPHPDLNSADILLAKASEMPLDSPLLQSMKGSKAHARAMMSPGINQLKEAFDVTYAVHRMEEEGANRRGYNAGNRGELLGLNEEDEQDEVEEAARKYGPEVGRAVERQRGARTSDQGNGQPQENSTSDASASQAQSQSNAAAARRQQEQQAAQNYPGRGGADPKLAAAALYDGRAGQRDRGGARGSNKRAFELNMNNATLLGRRGKAMDPQLGSLDSRILAGGSASPMRLDH